MSSLNKNLLNLAELYEALFKKSTPQVLRDSLQQSCNIVVIGGVNKGKSTFVNALLGLDELIPTSCFSSSACVFKVVFGEELTYTVHFLPSIGKTVEPIPPRRIQPNELMLYASTAENNELSLQVDYIEVTLNSELLRNGVTVVDTPGIGGENEIDVHRFVEQADVVFYLVDYSAPIDKNDCMYICNTLEITKNIFIIQSKSYLLSDAAAIKRATNNRTIIKSLWPEFKDEYFIMADAEAFFDSTADEGDLEQSGYLYIRRMCMQLIAKKNGERILQQIKTYWKPVFDKCRQALIKRIATVREWQPNAMEAHLETDKNANRNKMLSNQVSELIDRSRRLALENSKAFLSNGELCKSYITEIENCKEYNQLIELINGKTDELNDGFAYRIMQDLKKRYKIIINKFREDVIYNIQSIISTDKTRNVSPQIKLLSLEEINAILKREKQSATIVSKICFNLPWLTPVACFLFNQTPSSLIVGIVVISFRFIRKKIKKKPKYFQTDKDIFIKGIRHVFDVSYSHLVQDLEQLSGDILNLLDLTNDDVLISAQEQLDKEKEILQEYMNRFNRIQQFFIKSAQ